MQLQSLYIFFANNIVHCVIYNIAKIMILQNCNKIETPRQSNAFQFFCTLYIAHNILSFYIKTLYFNNVIVKAINLTLISHYIGHIVSHNDML